MSDMVFGKNLGKRNIILFPYEHLKAHQENDYFKNIKDNNMEKFYYKYREMGTISVIKDFNE